MSSVESDSVNRVLILLLISEEGSGSCCYNSCQNNKAAHTLTHLAFSSVKDGYWLEEVRSCIQNIADLAFVN